MGASDSKVRPESAATSVLDNRRIPCAIGLIKVADAVAAIPKGSTLKVLTRDRFARVEIPLWASRAGHRATMTSRAGTWPFRYAVFTVEVGDSSSR